MANRSQVVRISTGFLNTVNDANAGGANTADSSGLAPGQLGATVVFNDANVPFASATGTLYGGVYQYVQFKSGTTATSAIGGPVYWADRANFIVTPDPPTGLPDPAGIAIAVVSKGNYGFILVEGRVAVMPRSSITKVTPAIGDSVALIATANVTDDLADATTFNPNTHPSILVGQWLAAPANSTLTLAAVSFRKNPGAL